MKLKRTLLSLSVALVMLVSLVVSSNATMVISASLSLSGYVMDSGGLAQLGAYACSFNLPASSHTLSYTLNLDPPLFSPSSQSKSRLVYKAKRLNINYADANQLFESSVYSSFDAYIRAEAPGLTGTVLASHSGGFTTSATNISNSISITAGRLYYFDIDLSSIFRTLYGGDCNIDMVCRQTSGGTTYYYYGVN